VSARRLGGAAPHVLVAGLAVFALVTLTVVAFDRPPGDAWLREALLAAESPPVVTLMRVVNWGGNWRVLLPATLLLFVVFPAARPRWWLWVGLMVVAPSAEGILKEVIGRPRPEGTAYGFPSGHATAAAAFFGAVAYLAATLPPAARRPMRAAAVAAIVLIALARVLLRAHWPSDALGGVALGLALASLAALLADPGAGKHLLGARADAGSPSSSSAAPGRARRGS
jgi:undecaprenyl-diphosphatase